MFRNANNLWCARTGIDPHVHSRIATMGVLAIGDYGLCITLAAGASATSSLHFVPCAAISSASAHPPAEPPPPLGACRPPARARGPPGTARRCRNPCARGETRVQCVSLRGPDARPARAVRRTAAQSSRGHNKCRVAPTSRRMMASAPPALTCAPLSPPRAPAVVLPLTADWASSVVVDLASAKTEVHESVMAEVLRVMSKGAKISITHRDKDADTKAWTDRLVGCCAVSWDWRRSLLELRALVGCAGRQDKPCRLARSRARFACTHTPVNACCRHTHAAPSHTTHTPSGAYALVAACA